MKIDEEGPITGEVPVATTQLPDGVSKVQLYEKADILGSKYALGSAYTPSCFHL